MPGMWYGFSSSGPARDLRVSLAHHGLPHARLLMTMLTDSLQRETVLTIRADIVKSVQAGLSTSASVFASRRWLTTLTAWATSSKSKKVIKMNYVNYDNNIVLSHKCKIINWVGKFVNPSEIGSIEQLRSLRDAWASGSARWIRLSAPQLKAHMVEVEKLREDGEIIVKVRKQRSDAGQSRGGKRKLHIGNKENMSHNNKAKRARTQLPPKSREIIDSDDDRSDNESGGD
jgi:hypothetical protein